MKDLSDKNSLSGGVSIGKNGRVCQGKTILEFQDFFQGDFAVPKRNLLEKWGILRGQAELVLSLRHVVYFADMS